MARLQQVTGELSWLNIHNTLSIFVSWYIIPFYRTIPKCYSYGKQTVNDYGQHTSQLLDDKFPLEEVGNWRSFTVGSEIIDKCATTGWYVVLH